MRSQPSAIMRDMADEIERLRAALYQCGGMANEGISAPNAAYRWCERIEEVAMAGRPLEEYSKYLRREEPGVADH